MAKAFLLSHRRFDRTKASDFRKATQHDAQLPLQRQRQGTMGFCLGGVFHALSRTNPFGRDVFFTGRRPRWAVGDLDGEKTLLARIADKDESALPPRAQKWRRRRAKQFSARLSGADHAFARTSALRPRHRLDRQRPRQRRALAAAYELVLQEWNRVPKVEVSSRSTAPRQRRWRGESDRPDHARRSVLRSQGTRCGTRTVKIEETRRRATETATGDRRS